MREFSPAYQQFALEQFHSMWDTRFSTTLSWINKHHRRNGPDFLGFHKDSDVILRSVYGSHQSDNSATEMRWLLLLYHNQHNGFLGTRSIRLTFLDNHIEQRGLIGVSDRGKGYGSAMESATKDLLARLASHYQLPIHRYVYNENEKPPYILRGELSHIQRELIVEQSRWWRIYFGSVSSDYEHPGSIVYPTENQGFEPLPKFIKPSELSFKQDQ